MKLYGYCIECRKVKPVHVTGSALSRMAAGTSPPTGICDACRDADHPRAQP